LHSFEYPGTLYLFSVIVVGVCAIVHASPVAEPKPLSAVTMYEFFQ
jgi:hypothetical protein